MNTCLRILPFLLLGLPIGAQSAASLARLAHSPTNSVFTADPDPDGAVWLRGDRYKLCLHAHGATYQPLFGPRARRDYPLTLRLLGVANGSHEISRQDVSWHGGEGHFHTDHGAVVERWDCAPQHAQQSFVLSRPAVPGAIVLDLECSTDLQAVGEGPGVRFVAPNLGHVGYSDAVVIDAHGQRLEVPVEVDGNRLTITVPASFTATAGWPIVVDPFVTTVAFDTTISDIQDPRVACDPNSGNWLVVAEEHLSATDVDIVCKRYDGSTPPVLLDTVYAAITSALTHNPDVGVVAAAGKFVVAWHTTEGLGAFEFRNRTATSTVQGTAIQRSVGIGGNLDNRCRVGSSLTGNLWLLVMFRRNITGNDVLAQLLNPTGVGFGSTFVGPIANPMANIVAPGDVSTLRDVGDSWVVVWRECTDATCNQMKVRMQAIAPASVTGPLVPATSVDLVTTSLADEPAIAGFGGNLLAVWRTFDASSSSDIAGVPIGVTAGVFGPLGSVQNLSQQEPNVAAIRDQTRPSVSYDGCRFVYGYLEEDGNDTTLPHAATVHVQGSTIAWHEGHLPLPMVGNNDARTLDLGYGANNNFGVHWGVWQEDSATFTGDVAGAVIDARVAGPTSAVSQTGCGTPNEPGITLTGTPALGRTITVSLNNVVGFPFLLVGPESINLLPGCNGCSTGIDITAMTAFGASSLTVAVPCEPSLIQLRLAFQGLVLLQAGGCPSSVLGFAFTLSDTLTIQVL